MATYDRISGLPLLIDGYGLEGHVLEVSEEFTRRTTDIRLSGDGAEGLGEDVTYEGNDHEVLQNAGPVLDLAGDWTLGRFCEHLAGLDLFPAPPDRDVYRRYRRWAFESAALDLALRQSGLALHEALAREPRPVVYVVSLRLHDPPTIEPVRRRLELSPSLQFKIDPTNSWTQDLVDELVATGAVESLDLKGQYSGTIVDVEPDPALYRMLLDAFPDAWLEDPHTGVPEIDAMLEPHRDRVTWDAPVHELADIKRLARRMINVKPSRIGSIAELFEAYDHCDAHGIAMYGGGQFELSVGRGQIQYLASLFHADGPNDVAPGGWNHSEPPPGLPASPLALAVSETGFRWGE